MDLATTTSSSNRACCWHSRSLRAHRTGLVLAKTEATRNVGSRVRSASLLQAELLSRDKDTAIAVGAVEWYSWRETTLVATGWERTAEGAREKGQASWRNCSPTGNGWVLRSQGRPVEADRPPTTRNDRCYGPLPFLKGPLVLLSSAVVRWLNASALVERDVRQASELAAGRARAYRGPGSGRIPQDVSLGFWLSRHPTLRIVELQPFTTWCDKWKFVGNLRALLIAHRVPWERMAWLTEATRRLWSDSSSYGRLVCAQPVCSPGACAVSDGQVACRMEVALRRPSSGLAPDFGCFACRCWSETPPLGVRRWSNGTCRFSRTAVPNPAAQCWQQGVM